MEAVCETTEAVGAVDTATTPGPVEVVGDGRLRVNIGAGSVPIAGWVNLDKKSGTLMDDLPYDDGTVDEIRASHVLEHEGFGRSLDIMRHWARKLKPGGILSVAVPDIAKVIGRIERGDPKAEAYMYGGQTDEDDFHKAAFTYGKLVSLFRASGFQTIWRWRSDQRDCAALEHVTLNLRAVKGKIDRPDIALMMSVPALSWTDTVVCVETAVSALGLRSMKGGGAFWSHAMSNGFDAIVQDESIEWILTCDYDTIFDPGDVMGLLEIATKHGADAVCALQVKRDSSAEMLIQRRDADGNPVAVAEIELHADAIEVTSAHFGLTVIRRSALLDVPRPWFYSRPDIDGGWHDRNDDPNAGRVCDDIWFWRQFVKAGKKLMCAMDVPVGHMQRVITRPTKDLQAGHQFISDWQKARLKPDWAW